MTPPDDDRSPAPEGVEEQVVLLDAMGAPVGTLGKLAAHRAPGHWHAAFSAMLFDHDGQVLLQRRADGKYHFGGRWTNSCCSHPRPGESLADAVRRRVPEELGIDITDHDLRLAGSFWYRAADADSGLVEQEYDRVVEVHAVDPADVVPHPDEVGDVVWTTLDDARARSDTDPDAVTPWLHHVLDVLARRAAED